MLEHVILIMGIGNPLRRDDGAGWALAQQLAAALEAQGMAARVLLVQQLAPEHAVELAAPNLRAVCFVDAALAAPGLHLLPLRSGDTAVPQPASFTHEITPATLLAYAHLLEAAAVPAWLLTAGGADFGHGEGFSPALQTAMADHRALHAAAQQIAATASAFLSG